ncbi:hypothetical protein J22TS3_28150 [Paenibacillus sp. J22TS3]|nr:hypothetical protein J22TS3_28150 [Paenibacillus sp. J22TS3]
MQYRRQSHQGVSFGSQGLEPQFPNQRRQEQNGGQHHDRPQKDAFVPALFGEQIPDGMGHAGSDNEKYGE